MPNWPFPPNQRPFAAFSRDGSVQWSRWAVDLAISLFLNPDLGHRGGPHSCFRARLLGDISSWHLKWQGWGGEESQSELCWTRAKILFVPQEKWSLCNSKQYLHSDLYISPLGNQKNLIVLLLSCRINNSQWFSIGEQVTQGLLFFCYQSCQIILCQQLQLIWGSGLCQNCLFLCVPVPVQLFMGWGTRDDLEIRNPQGPASSCNNCRGIYQKAQDGKFRVFKWSFRKMLFEEVQRPPAAQKT